MLAAGPRFRVLISKRDSGEPRGTNEYLTWDHARLDALIDEVNRLVEQDSFVRRGARALRDVRVRPRRAQEEHLLYPFFDRLTSDTERGDVVRRMQLTPP